MAAVTQMVDFHYWSFTSNQLHIQHQGSRMVLEEDKKLINYSGEV